VTRWIEVVVVCAVHGSTIEQHCRITHHLQYHTVYQTSVGPASIFQDVWRGQSLIYALEIRGLSETAPCAGGVRQTSDDGGTIDELQSRVAQTVIAQHSKCVICLSTGCHELLNTLSEKSRLQRPHPAASGCGSARCPAV